MTSFTLKILAIIGMTANHMAHLLGSFMPWEATVVLYCLGGMTYATMAFLMVEGYLHTSNLRKYAVRLFVFALISQVPFSLAFGAKANVLFTLLLGLFLLWMWDWLGKRGGRLRWLFLPILAAVTGLSAFSDWAFTGPVMVWLFYVLRNRKKLGVVLTMIVPYAYTIGMALTIILPELPDCLSKGQEIVLKDVLDSYRTFFIAGVPIFLSGKLLTGISVLGYAIVGFTIATICICQYNGQRGRSMKWFFYAYYPAHLLVLWGLAQLLALL